MFNWEEEIDWDAPTLVDETEILRAANRRRMQMRFSYASSLNPDDRVRYPVDTEEYAAINREIDKEIHAWMGC